MVSTFCGFRYFWNGRLRLNGRSCHIQKWHAGLNAVLWDIYGFHFTSCFGARKAAVNSTNICLFLTNLYKTFLEFFFFTSVNFINGTRSNTQNKIKRQKKPNKSPTDGPKILTTCGLWPTRNKPSKKQARTRHLPLYDRLAINEHGSRWGAASFHRNQKKDATELRWRRGRNQYLQWLEPKSQYWWIYESEKERRRLPSILPLQLSCMYRSDIFVDNGKLEDAKPKSIEMENCRRIRTRGSQTRKNRSGDRAVPAKAI